MTYIVSTDITDRLIKPVTDNDSSYFTRADSALNDLATAKDVDTDDIETDPLHYRVKEFLVAWVGHEVCVDLMGVAPKKYVEEGVEDDPYEIKYRTYYKNELVKKKAQITPEILEGDADSPEEFAQGTTDLYRT